MDKVRAEELFGEPIIGKLDIPESEPVDYNTIRAEYIRSHYNAPVTNPDRVYSITPTLLSEKELKEVMYKKTVVEAPTKKSILKWMKDLFCKNEFPKDNYKK